ncbi:unnamed protein product [Lactuca virosa]|uniref:Zinc finger GRF-type domain-containing protein n=1 Tax=Lactuca virosa TaxID=75947 RepID=A0AAU9MR74_9ASTR|nr:unnamed protein product [Lactuca virosa]
MNTTSTRLFPVFNISLCDLEPLRSDSSSYLMSYLAGSSSANDTVVATRSRDKNLCNCRYPPKFIVERMSMYDKNPTCKFRNCVDSLVEMAAEKCKYFKWIDGELTPHYKHAFNNLKYELQLMKDTNYTGRL